MKKKLYVEKQCSATKPGFPDLSKQLYLSNKLYHFSVKLKFYQTRFQFKKKKKNLTKHCQL